MEKSIKIQIYGKVQGVWYRASTQRKAEELGLKGFVQNMPDGSVYVEASGNEKQLKALEDWCKEGPPFAKVTSIAVEDIEIQLFPNFEIRR